MSVFLWVACNKKTPQQFQLRGLEGKRRKGKQLNTMEVVYYRRPFYLGRRLESRSKNGRKNEFNKCRLDIFTAGVQLGRTPVSRYEQVRLITVVHEKIVEHPQRREGSLFGCDITVTPVNGPGTGGNMFCAIVGRAVESIAGNIGGCALQPEVLRYTLFKSTAIEVMVLCIESYVVPCTTFMFIHPDGSLECIDFSTENGTMQKYTYYKNGK